MACHPAGGVRYVPSPLLFTHLLFTDPHSYKQCTFVCPGSWGLIFTVTSSIHAVQLPPPLPPLTLFPQAPTSSPSSYLDSKFLWMTYFSALWQVGSDLHGDPHRPRRPALHSRQRPPRFPHRQLPLHPPPAHLCRLQASRLRLHHLIAAI